MSVLGMKITPSIPPRSVPRTAGVTPTSSKVISKAKEIGSTPSYTPSLKMAMPSDYSSNHVAKSYKQTIEDMHDINTFNSIQNASSILGAAGAMMATIGAAKNQPGLRNLGIALAGTAGISHGVFSKKMKSVEYRMNTRNSAIEKGFFKSAMTKEALGPFTIATVLADSLMGMGSIPHATALAADVVATPWLIQKAKSALGNLSSTGMRKAIGEQLTHSEKITGSLLDATSSIKHMAKEKSGNFAYNLAQSVSGISAPLAEFISPGASTWMKTRGSEVAKGLAEYATDIPALVAGPFPTAHEYVSKAEPVLKAIKKIDPEFASLLANAPRTDAVGKASYDALIAKGQEYQKAFKVLSDKASEYLPPGTKEQTVANTSAFYNKYLHPDKIGNSADEVVNAVAKYETAAAKIKEWGSNKGTGFASFLRRFVSKALPSQQEIVKALGPTQIHETVDKGIALADKVKDVSKAGIASGGIFLAGSIAGYGGEKMRDKAKSIEIKKELMVKNLNRNKGIA